MAKGVLIAGYYGFGNTGDEAILQAMLDDLRALRPGLAFTVISGNPRETSSQHGVRSILWTNVRAIVEAAQQCDLIILGGGGIFHDYGGVLEDNLLTRSHTGISFYSGLPLLALLAEKPSMVYSVGVGPLSHEEGKRLTRIACEQADVVTVRDIESAQILNSLGVARRRIRLTADAAFCLRADAHGGQEVLTSNRVLRTDSLVAVCLRNWDIAVDPQRWESEVAAGLCEFVDAHESSLLFVPFQYLPEDRLTNDLAVAERVADRLHHAREVVLLRGNYRPELIAGILAQCDLIVGMRYHSLVFAAKAGVPAIGLVYDQKVSNLMTRVDLQAYAISLPSLTGAELCAAMNRAWMSRAQIRERLATRGQELTRLAAENAKYAIALIDRRTTSKTSRASLRLLREFALKRTAQLAEKDVLVEAFNAEVVQKEQAIASLTAQNEQARVTLTAQVAEQDRKLNALVSELAQNEQARVTLTAQVAEQDRKLNALASELAQNEQARVTLTAQVAVITSSMGWSLLQRLWRLRLLVAPRGSKRERALHLAKSIRLWRGQRSGDSNPPLQVAHHKSQETRHGLVNTLSSRIWHPAVPGRVLKFLRKGYRRLPPRLREAAWHAYRQFVARRAKLPPSNIPSMRQRSTPLPSLLRSHRVSVLAPTFFDQTGNTMYYGGAERYLIELVRLIRELGYEVEVYQSGAREWVRYYRDIRVVGLDTDGDFQRLNEVFHAEVPASALTIYLAFYLATPRCHSPGIGISHGIYWDNPAFQASSVIGHEKISEALAAMENLSAIISVDTNTMNWVRSTRFDLTQKFVYIPNFVDLERFRPNRPHEAKERLVVLYPRRLYEPRGFWLIIDILPDIVKRFSFVDFHFVGRADPREETEIRNLMARYPTRVRWNYLPPEQMQEAYQSADITLIPTMHSEGTSLSCLEAQACGNAVIATSVGGLSDLILHEFNGLLIEPSAGALQEALIRLIEDERLRHRLGHRAVQVAQTFSIERWRQRWRQSLRTHLPEPRHRRPRARRPVALFLDTPGIVWERMKQRPHHLAWQMALHGIDTYWVNPTGQLPSPHPRLHIVASTDDLYLQEPIVFIHYPFHYERLRSLTRPFVIYDVLDDIRIHAASDQEHKLPAGRRARDYHLRLFAEADLVMTSSKVLHELIKPQRPDALLVLNGVEAGFFGSANPPSVDQAAESRGPIIGYHGAIAEWFDVDLVAEVAQRRRQYQFVLIGPVSVPQRIQSLQRLPNVSLLGELPYEQLPRHISAYNIGILPFVVNDITRAARPLKVLEYLAMHKPVVATKLPELNGWPGVLCATTADEFAERLDEALTLNLEHSEELTRFLRASSWAQTTRPLLRAINRAYVHARGEIAPSSR